MDHDLGVRQGEALALRAGRQQECTHGRSHADADRGNIALDILHGVVNRKSGRYHAARAVDVELNVLVGVLRLQIEKLGDDQAGGRVVDLLRQEDDAVVQKAGENVIGTLSAARLLDDIGNQTHNHAPFCVHSRRGHRRECGSPAAAGIRNILTALQADYSSEAGASSAASGALGATATAESAMRRAALRSLRSLFRPSAFRAFLTSSSSIL